MVGSFIRRCFFWLIDFLKGRPIRKHYLDIKKIMHEEGRFSQLKYLNSLLFHAKSTVPYYAGLSCNTISDFPVITKAIIKDNYEDFNSVLYKDTKKHSMSTSGSTGTPFTIFQDINKRNRVLAELIFFNSIIGQRVGDRFIFTRVWTKKDLSTGRNSRLGLIAKNEIAFDITSFNDENMERLRTLLKRDKSINEIMGYASTNKRLVQYLEKCGDSAKNFNLHLVLSGSEMLETVARRKLQKMFNCTVVSRYSNQENGVLAQQTPESEKYTINLASYYLEILKLDCDEPAEIGEMGRIVITDLFNYAMPMIRYDTGDLGKFDDEGERINYRVLKSVEGRRVDVCTDPNGRKLSPFLFDKHMEKFDQLSQFQFVQKGKNEYTLRINDPKNAYTDDVMLDMLIELLGINANCNIERMTEIPCMASGKFKQMVCEYHED